MDSYQPTNSMPFCPDGEDENDGFDQFFNWDASAWEPDFQANFPDVAEQPLLNPAALGDVFPQPPMPIDMGGMLPPPAPPVAFAEEAPWDPSLGVDPANRVQSVIIDDYNEALMQANLSYMMTPVHPQVLNNVGAQPRSPDGMIISTLSSTTDQPSSPTTWTCEKNGCTRAFVKLWELHRHQDHDPHAPGHFAINDGPPYVCQCGLPAFAKKDTLFRHIRIYQDSVEEHRCPECTEGRPRSFKRKDKLVQHLQHFHKFSDAEIASRFPRRKVIKNFNPVCHIASCPYYRDDEFRSLPLDAQERDMPFSTQTEYTKHMREAHDWSPYPCTIPGCNRKGKDGYFNQKALLKHREDKHPDAEPLTLERRRPQRLPCGFAGCRQMLHPQSLAAHRYDMHQRPQWITAYRYDMLSINAELSDLISR